MCVFDWPILSSIVAVGTHLQDLRHPIMLLIRIRSLKGFSKYFYLSVLRHVL
jgi:hypothetical protein